MPETTLRVPSLHGGISRQPPEVRFGHQVEDATNAHFSVVDGCSKRPGTRLVGYLPASVPAADANLRLFPIDRDGSERYLVVYGDGVLRVFELLSTGGMLEATVTVDADAQTYLDSGSATADELRLCAIADYTLIVNTKVALGALTSTAFTVTSEWPDFSVMTSSSPAASTYHRTREDDAINTAGYWQYTSSAGYAKWTGPTITSGTSWNSPTESWDDVGKNPMGCQIGFIRQSASVVNASWTFATLRLVKAGAFTNLDLTKTPEIHLTGGTGVTAGWATIKSKVDNDTIDFDGAIALADAADVSFDGFGTGYEISVDFQRGTYTDMHDIAAKLQQALRDAGATDALIGWDYTANNEGRMIVVSPYKGTSRWVVVDAPYGSQYDLTVAGRPFATGTQAEGTGTHTTANDTQAVLDRWTRKPPPNQPEAMLDPDTMPVKMTRTAYTGDGSTPAEFSVDPIVWGFRETGDEVSNPVPALWADGRTIADIAFHRNRLVLAGDTSVVMSQSDNLFQFYLEDPTNLVDSDPIERTLSSERVALIDHIVGFRQGLFVTTEAGMQFEMSAPSELTYKTAAFTPTTNYQTLAGVRPALMGEMVYFAGRGIGGDAAVYEYYYDDSRASNFAADITAHVRGLLPTTIRTLFSVPNAGALAALTGANDKLYYHRLHWGGQGKEQSAWSVYDFAGVTRIADAAVIGDDIYLLNQVGAPGWTIERLPGAQDEPLTGMPYAIHLDRQRTITGSYNAGTDRTTWTWAQSDSGVDTIVLGAAFGTDAGKVLGDTSEGADDTLTLAANSASADGDYSTGAAYAGLAFNFSIELSRPYYRDPNGAALPGGWLHLYRIQTGHHDSGRYTIRGQMPRRTDRTKEFVPPSGRVQERGTHLAYWTGEPGPGGLVILVESSGPEPVVITSIEYLADYEPRRG